MSAQRIERTRLAVDAGQTGIKARVTVDGETVSERLFPGVRTHEPLIPQLTAVASAVIDAHGAPIDAMSFGVSGLTSAEADASALLAALGHVRPGRVLLAHDSITSYLGALGDRAGAVVASGTGAVTLAVGATRAARVDGWGNIMGDAGSAYWIGREALEAVMRAHDGRAPATALTEVVRARWPQLEDAYIDLQSDPDRVSVVASLAAAVDAHAGADATAARIAQRAAGELANSAMSALERVSDPEGLDEEPVAAIGGVFRSELILSSFERVLTHGRARARLVPAVGDGLDGAARLTELSAGHALQAEISVAVDAARLATSPQ